MKQINELRAMGIKIMSMPDGRVQLLHTASDVRLATAAILVWRMIFRQIIIIFFFENRSVVMYVCNIGLERLDVT